MERTKEKLGCRLLKFRTTRNKLLQLDTSNLGIVQTQIFVTSLSISREQNSVHILTTSHLTTFWSRPISVIWSWYASDTLGTSLERDSIQNPINILHLLMWAASTDFSKSLNWSFLGIRGAQLGFRLLLYEKTQTKNRGLFFASCDISPWAYNHFVGSCLGRL